MIAEIIYGIIGGSIGVFIVGGLLFLVIIGHD